MRGCSDNESNPRCLHAPTNCFQLINGAEVRSRYVYVRRESDDVGGWGCVRGDVLNTTCAISINPAGLMYFTIRFNL